jgi:predicted transcriptional regulator
MSNACCGAGLACNDDCLQLTERELEICGTVCSSGAPIGFSTIKKTVGYHQEIVSRILRRLVTYGVIERASGKYRRKVGQ